MGAGRYERTATPRGHRNGHYTRDLGTTHGPLPRLRVPRLLEGGVDFTLLDKYQRRQTAVDAAIGQLFLQGISTWKLNNITQTLFGAPVSAGTVSKAAAVLDADVQAYQTKPLPDDIAFLFLNGITQKVRELGVEGKVMLCAFGIHRDGRKELLSFRLVDREETTTWRVFLVDLKSRRLQGKHLQLITIHSQSPEQTTRMDHSAAFHAGQVVRIELDIIVQHQDVKGHHTALQSMSYTDIRRSRPPERTIALEDVDAQKTLSNRLARAIR